MNPLPTRADPELEPPLAGVRVLEFSYSRPARIAGQLLAEFGADVVRAVSTGAERPEIREPGDVSWDRGKRLVVVDESEIASLVEGADIFIVDRAPSKLAELGIREQDLDPKRSGLVYVWLPPYGPRGEWAELAEDPLLLAAVGGVACQYPGTRPGIPVAPVVSNITQVHGALGAAAALAGLQGLEANGYGYGVTVSGLQASAAVLTAMTLDTLDVPMVRPARHRRGPNWRFYRGSDGRWFFLATLTPDLFLRALTVIERADVLAFPEVDGDFYKILGDEAAGRVVGEALEAHFAAEPTEYWLDLFAKNNVAAAAIQTREEWTEGEIIAANGGFVTRIDEELGEVSMPGVPIRYEDGGLVVGELPPPLRPRASAAPIWRGAGASRPAPAGEYRMPLTGLRVVDAASFLAGPFVSSLLSEFGAEVIRVEPPTGDTYRAYPTAFLSVNKYKRGLALHVPRPEGAEVLRELVRTTDVLVENLRPARMERIGLGRAVLEDVNPQLIHVSVSAYGAAEAFADAPGFDPVFQSLSGMAGAQGGASTPYDSGVPTADTATGVLGAIGALAALRRRRLHRVGSRLGVSLADAVTFLQFSEFTTYRGSPAPAAGRDDYAGPSATKRFFECADGWIAVNAGDDASARILLDVAGVADAAALAGVFLRRSVEEVVRELAAAGVDVVRSLLLETSFDDPFPVANDWMHVVQDREFGRSLIMRGYSDWSTTEGRRDEESFRIGEESRDILREHGIGDRRVQELIGLGVVRAPDRTGTAG